MTFQRRQQQTGGRAQGSSRAAPNLLLVELCHADANKGRPHIPIQDESGSFCSFCGLQCGEPDGHLVRDFLTETKQNAPVHPNAGPRKGLGSDPGQGAYDLARVGLSNSRKQIVYRQKHGETAAMNDDGVLLGIVSDNNLVGPAAKNHIRGSEYKQEKLKLQNVSFEAQKIFARMLEDKRIDLNSQKGLDLGARLITTWGKYFADTVTKLTLQTNTEARTVLHETNLPLVLELCLRAWAEVMNE